MITYILYTIIKSIALSAVCYLIFGLLIRRRVSFTGERVFLLFIPAVSLLFASISMDAIGFKVNSVTPVGDAIIHLSELSDRSDLERKAHGQYSGYFDEHASAHIALPQSNIESESSAESAPLPYTFIEQDVATNTAPSFNYLVLIFALWGVGVLIFAVRYLLGLYGINRLRRASTYHTVNGVNIYNNPIIEGAFSFFHSIFVNSELRGERFDVVIKHELAHINNRHYIDKSIIELYSILLWFNPVVWQLRRELGMIHEFQADGVVLHSGCDMKQYKHFIFDEATGGVPAISNGFNNSLIKERFLQMKKSYQTKSSWFTRVVVSLTMLLLFIAVSCTFIQRNTPKDLSADYLQGVKGIMTVNLKDGTTRSDSTAAMTLWLVDNASLVESIKVEPVEVEVEKRAEELKPEPPVYYVNDNQVNFIARDDFVPYSIYRRDGYTEMDRMHEIYSDWYWTYTTSNGYLLDRKSGDRYPIIGIAKNKPMNHRLVIRKHEGEYAMHTLIFPPIKEGVEYLDYIGGDLPDSLRRPTNVMPKSYTPDIKVNGDIERPYHDTRGNAVIKISKKDLPKF